MCSRKNIVHQQNQQQHQKKKTLCLRLECQIASKINRIYTHTQTHGTVNINHHRPKFIPWNQRKSVTATEKAHTNNKTRQKIHSHTHTHIIQTLWKRQNQKYINYPAECVCVVIQLITECRIQHSGFSIFFPLFLSISQTKQKKHTETGDRFCFFSSLQFRM